MIQKSDDIIIKTLARSIDAKSAWTAGHSERVTRFAVQLGKTMGLDSREQKILQMGSLLHDIGKIGVPDQILRKPGPLTDEEWVIMKRHPEIGAEIVSPVEKLGEVAPLIRAHQEKFDGTGYPDGLKGEGIPKGARIIAVADAYSAMIDERIYRKSRSHKDAIAEIKRCTGSQFDPAIVAAFLKVIER